MPYKNKIFHNVASQQERESLWRAAEAVLRNESVGTKLSRPQFVIPNTIPEKYSLLSSKETEVKIGYIFLDITQGSINELSCTFLGLDGFSRTHKISQDKFPKDSFPSGFSVESIIGNPRLSSFVLNQLALEGLILPIDPKTERPVLLTNSFVKESKKEITAFVGKSEEQETIELVTGTMADHKSILESYNNKAENKKAAYFLASDGDANVIYYINTKITKLQLNEEGFKKFKTLCTKQEGLTTPQRKTATPQELKIISELTNHNHGKSQALQGGFARVKSVRTMEEFIKNERPTRIVKKTKEFKLEHAIGKDLGLVYNKFYRSKESKKIYITQQHKGQDLVKYLSWINEHNQNNFDELCSLGIKAAICTGEIHSGIQSVSNKEYTHHDIKPANFTIDAQDKVHLIDFGFSRVSNDSQLADINKYKGSPLYSPAEDMYSKMTYKQLDSLALLRTIILPHKISIFEEGDTETTSNEKKKAILNGYEANSIVAELAELAKGKTIDVPSPLEIAKKLTQARFGLKGDQHSTYLESLDGITAYNNLRLAYRKDNLIKEGLINSLLQHDFDKEQKRVTHEKLSDIAIRVLNYGGYNSFEKYTKIRSLLELSKNNRHDLLRSIFENDKQGELLNLLWNKKKLREQGKEIEELKDVVITIEGFKRSEKKINTIFKEKANKFSQLVSALNEHLETIRAHFYSEYQKKGNLNEIQKSAEKFSKKVVETLESKEGEAVLKEIKRLLEYKSKKPTIENNAIKKAENIERSFANFIISNKKNILDFIGLTDALGASRDSTHGRAKALKNVISETRKNIAYYKKSISNDPARLKEELISKLEKYLSLRKLENDRLFFGKSKADKLAATRYLLSLLNPTKRPLAEQVNDDKVIKMLRNGELGKIVRGYLNLVKDKNYSVSNFLKELRNSPQNQFKESQNPLR